MLMACHALDNQHIEEPYNRKPSFPFLVEK